MQNDTEQRWASRKTPAKDKHLTMWPIPTDLPPSTRKTMLAPVKVAIALELRKVGIDLLELPVGWIEQALIVQAQGKCLLESFGLERATGQGGRAVFEFRTIADPR